MRIAFVGFMGSGKTTLGHALARQKKWTYYDLDWYIETRHHTTIAHIFQTEGEERFRQIEHNLLHEVAEFEHVVIGCGGGTPCYYDNMDYLNRQALTIYLRADADTLYQHLATARTQRPLWHNLDPQQRRQQLQQMLTQREPFYMRAKHIVNVSHFDNLHDIDSSLRILQQEMPELAMHQVDQTIQTL